MAGKYKSWSPYNYVVGNPISLIDPNGAMAVYVDGVKQDGYEAELWKKEAAEEDAPDDDCCPPNYGLGYSAKLYGKEGIKRHTSGSWYAAAGYGVGLGLLLSPAYAQSVGTNLLFEAGESLVFGENHDLSGIDYFDVLNPIKGFGGNLMNAAFNFDKNGAGVNGLKDGLIELAAGETGSFLGRKLQGRGAELLEKSESIGNYRTLFPTVNPTTGRRNFGMSVSRATQQASDAKAGAGLLKRGGNQGTVTGIVMENILKSF